MERTNHSSERERRKINISSQAIEENRSMINQKSNTIENSNVNQSNSNNNNSINVINFINEMPFENLNDYYDIESSFFLKRIEKLNLKFYWTSECVLNNKDIKYPYNKLFLILFKQISLYIEEITRLNKQLKQKNKNEKYYQIKIAQLNQKEKENILNKQMLKNLQRDNKILEKKNEKFIIEIEKLNKKLSNSYKNINMNNINNTTTNVMYLNKNNNFYLGSPKDSNNSNGYGSLVTNNNVLNKKEKLSDSIHINNDEKKNLVNVKIKNKRISNSIDDSYFHKMNKTKNEEDIINQGILQCDEEIENLEMIEDILQEIKNKNNLNQNITNNNSKSITKESNINQGKNKKDRINNKSGMPGKKYFHRLNKSDLEKKNF